MRQPAKGVLTPVHIAPPASTRPPECACLPTYALVPRLPLPASPPGATWQLAEMFEAVMGAIYLDGDLDAVRRCYMTHFPLPQDPLTLLQPGSGGEGNGGAAAGSSPWE